MALLKRELYRQVTGPEITREDRFALVFDTDSKSLYVEREVVHLEAGVGGRIDYQTATMDIADYLRRGGQTAGHRELWRLLRTIFKEGTESAEYTDGRRPQLVDVCQIHDRRSSLLISGLASFEPFPFLSPCGDGSIVK